MRFSPKKLVYLDGQQAVLYRSRVNPSLGRSFEALDPLEWLARMNAHGPDPGQHRTLLHGHGARYLTNDSRREASESGIRNLSGSRAILQWAASRLASPAQLTADWR
jgi:hypothetical protein